MWPSKVFSQPLPACTVRQCSAASSSSSRRPSLTTRERMQSSIWAREGSILRLSGTSLKTSANSTSFANESCSSSTPPSGTSSPGSRVNLAACSATTGRIFRDFSFSFHLRSKGERSAAWSQVRFCRFVDHCSRNSSGGLVSRNSVQAVQRMRAPSRWPSSQKTSTHLLNVGKFLSSNSGLPVTLPTQLRKTTAFSSVAEVLHVTAEPNFSSK
mmetsp:Transcript_117595/g.366327  ORF Transcript_117595/g.366327 Transcript_117595/m.366327 type:complete len:213 (+) Transcript_117595:2759-3397(+)